MNMDYINLAEKWLKEKSTQQLYPFEGMFYEDVVKKFARYLQFLQEKPREKIQELEFTKYESYGLLPDKLRVKLNEVIRHLNTH